ncbi:Galactokinase [Aphelenchoides besseyi]|nr:Galactokinase [Aphelenchoides besseyi]
MDDDRFKREFLSTEFEKRFDQKAKWIVRSPGRVNLIGEHVDYSGYGVLPMATAQSIYVTFAPNDKNLLILENTDGKYEQHTYDVTKEWTGTTKPSWFHYFLSGYQGAKEHLKSVGVKGLNILVHGEVPAAAGLSSSSALVCAAVSTTLIGFTEKIWNGFSKNDVADIAIKSERLVGLEGGGMDQAVCALAKNNAALRIEFEPLSVHEVQLPSDALFCCLHSHVESNKAATAHYNERVVECRIAAQILYKKSSQSEGDEWKKIRRLKDVQDSFKWSLDECKEAVERLLKQTSYSRKDVLKELQANDKDLSEFSLNKSTQEMETFYLYPRAKHVFTESARVDEFEKACAVKDLKLMGKIMDESHNSCRDLYNCSCPELDEIVKSCKQLGARGSRLTGAGWGGCAVALFDAKDKEKVENEMDILFWSHPAAGIEALEF